MRKRTLLPGLSLLLLLFSARASFGQASNGAPLITQVTPPSLAPAPSPTQIVQFTLTIVGANFPPNPAVKLTLGEGPSLYAASASVNVTGTQIVAQFNTTLPRPAVYAVTVANAVNNSTRVSNVFYLPVTPSANTVGVVQTSTGFLSGVPEAVAVGDFNGDGNPDIAVVSQNSNTVSILLGTPGGVFNPGASYPTGNLPSGIVASDFNGDGVLDLAFTNAGDNTVTILLGNGDGTFRPGTTITDPGVYPTRLVAADFNLDGALDLAVINVCGPGTGTCAPQAGLGMPGSVTLLLGKGDGTFTVSANSPDTGVFPSAIAAADLNQDGVIDLVIANQSSNTLTLLMGNGDGTFTAAADVPTRSGPDSIAVADFNNDGKPDLAVANSFDQSVSVFLNQNCSGEPALSCTFTSYNGALTGKTPIAVAAADMNADGYVDLIVLNASDNTVWVIPNNEAAFAPTIGLYPVMFSTNAGPNALGLAIADFNGDGRLDMLTLNQSGSYSLLLQTPVPQVILTGSNPTPLFGAFLTFTANLVPAPGEPQPTGMMTFYDGTNVIGSALVSGNQATFTNSTLTTGAHQITATYCCDPSALNSTSNAVTETVSQAPTTVTLNSNVNTVPYGQPFTLSATVQSQTSGTPTGTVGFFDTSTSSFLPSATLANGVAQLTLSNLSPGAHVITATYNGDFNFTGSSSATYQENITQASTTLTISESPSQAQFAQPVRLTASLQFSGNNPATGTVIFYDGGTSLGSVSVSNNSATLSISTLSVGTHAISAQYSGDNNFLNSSGNSTETIIPCSTTVALTAGINPSVYGSYISMNATITPAFGSFPSEGVAVGQVAFYDGTTLLGTQTILMSPAGLAVQTLTAGNHTLTAQWLGNANYAPSTSNAVTQTVTQAASTTSVYTLKNPSAYGQSVTVDVAVDNPYHLTSSGGTIILFDNGTQIATGAMSQGIAFFPLTTLAVGAHSLTASYSGDNDLKPSTSTAFTQNVSQAATTTSVSLSASSVNFGQSATLTATVQAAYTGTPTGTVTFLDGTTTLGTSTMTNGSAQFTASALTPGAHSISAKYNGDTNFTASNSTASQTLTINQATTTTTVSTSLNPSTYGQPVTFSATVQAGSVSGAGPTGSIIFLNGSTTLGTVPLSSGTGQLAVSSLAAGSQSITAQYSGDSNFAGSTSTALAETVNPAATSTVIAANANPAAFGQAVTVTATVQPPAGFTATGTITFLDGTNSLGTATLANNSGQFTLSALAVGTHSITAVYSGSANFAASTSAVLTETVNQAATTTTVTASPNPSVFNQSVIFAINVSAAAGGTPTGTVSLMDGSTTLSTATLSGAGTHIYYGGLSPATHSITAVYSGDPNFTGSTSAAQDVVVNQASSTTSLSSSLNPSTYGQAVTLTAAVQAPQGIFPFGAVTFMDGSTTLGSASLSNGSAQLTLSGLAAGSHSISAAYGGNTYLTGSTSAALSQSVSTASSATTVSSSANPATFSQVVVLSVSIQASFGGSATGTVTFLDGTTALGTAPVAGNAAQLSVSSLAVGSHSITAKYNGDANVAGSTSTALAQAVNQAATTTTVTSGANPAVFGQSVTFSVRIQSSSSGTPTGTVALMDGTSSLGSAALPANGVGQFTISSLAPGTHAISASYSGDTNYGGSTSSVLTETVNPASTTASIAASPNPAAFGQAVMLTASVTPSVSGNQASGAVTFFDGSTSLGTANLSNNSAQLLVSNLAAGSHSITANYSGDANFSGSTSAALTETVNQVSTTTTLVSSLNPAVAGQSVTFTATVQAGAGNSVAGTVSFMDGSSTLGTVTLASNSAQLTVSTLAVGAHSVTAVYSGSIDFSGSTSAVLTETVNLLPTTTTVASSLNPATFGQAVTLTATVQAGSGISVAGTVTFLDGSLGLGTVTLASNSAQFTTSALAPGAHTLTAVYNSNGNFATSTSAALTETVNQLTTTTTLSSSANPALAGQTVTFTATVQAGAGNSAIGTVAFLDGSTTLGSTAVTNNSAQLTISTLAVGSHSITAAFSGSTDFAASTSSVLTETVNQLATTTTVASSLNPATFGQAVTLTATVQAGSGVSVAGTITFLDGTTSLGTATVSSNGAQLSLSSLSAGAHQITAKYNGDANLSGSTSPSLTQTVNQASTTTAVVSSTNPSAFGQTVTLTASVQSSSSGTPTGNVSFFDGSTSLGSVNLSGSSAQLTLASLSLGSHSIAAKYSGDSNYAASSSASLTQSVGQSGSTTTLSSNANPSSFGQAVTFTATIQPSYSGTPTGSVTFFDGGTSLGSISLTGGSAQLTLSNLSLGSHSISAKYNGDSNFTASTSTSIAESINQAGTSTTVSSNANPSSYGQVVTFTATVASAYSGAPTGNVTFFDGSTSLGNSNLSGGVATFSTQAAALVAGSHSITAKYNGDSHFLVSTSAAFAQTVGAAATVITLAPNSNPSPIGQSVNFTAHVSSAVSGNLTGTVNFYLDGGTTPVFSVALSGGNAQYTTSSLSGGTHSITAAFVSTNANFNGSTSTSLTQTITDFIISASPASDTIARGSSGTYTLTVTPVGGLTGNVSLNCNGAPGGTHCSISPGQVTLNGVNSAQASVTVTVDKNATVGTYTLTLKATSGPITHSTTVTLTIN